MTKNNFSSKKVEIAFDDLIQIYENADLKQKRSLCKDGVEICGTLFLTISAALFILFAGTAGFSIISGSILQLSLLTLLAIFTFKISAIEKLERLDAVYARFVSS